MKNTDYTDKKKKAQAILELAIFGSILIMLLGYLISYGLRYNYQQKIMQQAFRKALVGDPPHTSVSHIVIKDIHIPNPSHPFAVGAVQAFSSSAGVVRNPRLDEVAEQGNRGELPIVKINIQGTDYRFTTAGFRTENNVPEDSVEKYREIYGGSNVDEPKDEDSERSRCSGPETINTEGYTECSSGYSKDIAIIDSMEGEIIDYETAVKQCLQIVDEEVFQKECERGKQIGSDTDCVGISRQVMNPPNQSDNSNRGGAWYCANYIRTPNSVASLYTYRYTFPVLDQLFALTGAHKAMGIQPDYTQNTRINTELRKQEGSEKITTTDTLDWRDTTTRKIIYKDTSGNLAPPWEVESNVSQEGTKTWTTNW